VTTSTLHAGVLVALVLGAPGCGKDGTTTSSPPPPGKTFGVGVVTRDLVDSTRPTPANGAAPMTADRRLTTEIWYPAPKEGAEPEVTNAPLATSDGPFPLVLFVHGFGTSRRQSIFLTQALASAGYVVVAADFPFTASSSPGGESDLHVEDQTEDLQFLADQAAALAGDAKDALHGAIDPSQGYAVVGHSTGGTVALLAAYGAGHDDRLRAAVSISGDSCFFAPSFFETRSVPLLALTGSRDLLVPPPDNIRRTYELAAAPKVYASIVGGNHLGFSDFDIDDAVLSLPPTTASSDLAKTLAAYGDGAACEPIPPPSSDAKLDFDAQHALAIEIVSTYLDAVMLGLGEPLAELEAAADPKVVIEHDP